MEEKEINALLLKIKEQTEKMLLDADISKEKIEETISKRMKAIEGFDAEALKGLLDADKGVLRQLETQKAALKVQGEKITAMEESAAGKSNPDKFSFKAFLKTQKDSLKKLFEEGAEGKGEVVMNLSKAAAVMTTANTITGDDALPDSLIESFNEGSFVAKRQPREYVYDLANVTNVAELDKYKTWLEEGDVQGNFAVVAEGGLKPLVSAGLVRNYATARKVAGKYVVTEEFTKFYKKAYAIIKRIIEQQMLRDKAAILVTDLLADAAPYTGSALDNQYADPNDFQAIAAVAAQIESLNFMPDMLIINPQDKWRIGMSVAEDGHFFMPNVPVVDPTGNMRILGFIVRTSNRVPVGNFFLGESGLWEIEQEGITVRVGYGVTVTGANPVTAVVSDFDNNQIRVIVEQYFINYIATNNEGSYVYANFSTVKAALEGSGS